MKDNKKSPCINLCEYSAPSGWCIGCGRTREETQRWKKMKPFERQSLLKPLKKRLSQIE